MRKSRILARIHKQMKKYDFKKIEKKWQTKWAKDKIYSANDFDSKPKKYVLIEFPYPSGEGLHMGHLRPYVAGDIYSRYLRMKGFNVVYPIGWDAFGLPAENYAIKHGVQPSVSTAKNVKNAKRQMMSWGLSFDWEREVNTTDPNYFKWTQWIFLQLFKKGLAYESTGLINWCPKDKTGLANEEVVNGRCDRCGTVVEQKELRQWYLKITEYAEKLLEGLKHLPEWPEAVKIQQENWIGKSEGAIIRFDIESQTDADDTQTGADDGQRKSASSRYESALEVFTTRPDTLFGATYLVLSPEGKYTKSFLSQITNREEVENYIERTKKRTEEERTAEGKEKTGAELKGIFATNPTNGERIPVWISDYVLANYGTGAIMAVPAHDERDFEFAKKFNLPIRVVLHEKAQAGQESIDAQAKEYLRVENKKKEDGEIFAGAVENGYLINSGKFNLMPTEKAKWEITKLVGGRKKIQYKLRDWVFSRQRYWGEPIPLIHCGHCAVPENKEKAKLELNFYYPEVWEALKNGTKKLETRALNPEEPERYFGNIKVGDSLLLSFKDKKTKKVKEQLIFRVKSSNTYKDISALFADKNAVVKFSNKKYSSVKELEKGYSYTPDYLERIKKNGLIAWEIEPVTVTIPVPEKNLPVVLPKVKKYEPTGTGESPLAGIASWVNTKCPNCKGDAKRETNTMPQWAGSSWYWLRYADPKNKKELADKKKLEYWTPVDVYFGGMEHTTLHLLYSRFWNLFLYDQGIVPVKEPYVRRQVHGMILASNGEKMSKSRGNVVNPDFIAGQLGADTLRMYEVFLGPHDMSVSWSDQGIMGIKRFLDRVWKLVNGETIERQTENPEAHKAIKKVGEDLEGFRYNTAVSATMIFLNKLEAEGATQKDKEVLVKLIAPFAPHIAEELWLILNPKAKSIHISEWPKFDPKLCVDESVKVGVQINGKLKDVVELSRDISEDEVKKIVLSLEKINSALGGSKVKRFIYVPNKIINIVI